MKAFRFEIDELPSGKFQVIRIDRADGERPEVRTAVTNPSRKAEARGALAFATNEAGPMWHVKED